MSNAVGAEPSNGRGTIALAEELPRTDPKSPEDSKACIQLAAGFEIELVAAEPLVVDPVAFAFDSRGRLFVCEMVDYSEQENEALGRIAMLDDIDGDGQMDQRSVFVDRLSWPTAIHPWKDGVIVIAPPKLTWFRDTDDDGQHDRAEEWYTGFGRSNVQGMANSLRWGVEGYVVGVTSSTGAELTTPLRSGESLSLRGRDFRIDPVAKTLKPISGGSQNGMAMNRWGDRFVTSNSDHLQQVIDLDEWLQSHSVANLPVTTRRSIAVDGQQAEVYRSSPIEPWRIVRTRMRVNGEAPGAIEGGGRAAGYFTGASGTWVMDSEMRFGVDTFDTACVCDSGSNLVHRKKLESNGLFWKASRIDEQSELLRSSEVWFRPVQLGDGPDGSLYIADMYREFIEHPKSIPISIKQHLDLTSGNDRGRIWRLKRTDSSSSIPLNLPKASNAELVQWLLHPIAWQRRMASQLLIERQAQDVAQHLKQLVTEANKPESAILALHILARLDLLDRQTLMQAISSKNTETNRHAIDLLASKAEWISILNDKPTMEALLRKGGDARLCLSIAVAASKVPIESRLKILGPLMSTCLQLHSDEPTLLSIVTAATGTNSFQLLSDPSVPNSTERRLRNQLLKLLTPYWAHQLTKADKTGKVHLETELRRIFHEEIQGDEARTLAWLSALTGLKTNASQNQLLLVASAEDREKFIKTVEAELEKARSDEEARQNSVAFLRFSTPNTRSLWLDQFIIAREAESDQFDILDACMFTDPTITLEKLLHRQAELTPKIRDYVFSKATEHPESLMVLAKAIESKKLNAAQLPPSLLQTLQRHPNLALRDRFNLLIQGKKSSSEEIQKTIDRYASMADAADVSNQATLERGKAVFEKDCALCHRIDNLGNDVGPPLKSLHEKSPGQLLVSILDPNREVDPKFQAWIVLLDDGRTLTGVIREESASQIVLAGINGATTTIEREEIEQMKSSGVSLMPTGLYQQLTPENTADLIAWLRSRR